MLKFTCPDCDENVLECVEIYATVSYDITHLDEDGDFDYGPTNIEDGEINRFQCVNCGYILKDNNSVLTSNDEVIAWLRKNCNQD
jgi:predicted RNA-binding Zn-ribbon protein involved in translation (DUF1610 family)